MYLNSALIIAPWFCSFSQTWLGEVYKVVVSWSKQPAFFSFLSRAIWFLQLHRSALWLSVLKYLFTITRHITDFRITPYFENLCFRGSRTIQLDRLFAFYSSSVHGYKMSVTGLRVGCLVWWNILTWFRIRNQEIWILSPILQLNYLPIWSWEVSSQNPSYLVSGMGMKIGPCFYVSCSVMSSSWDLLCVSSVSAKVLCKCWLCSWDVYFMK